MERKKYQIIVSIILNSIIILFEIFSLLEVFIRFLPGALPFKWYHSLTYYTNLGNIVLLIGSILCLINDIKELKGLNNNKIFTLFKFVGVVLGMVIFVTIYIIIIMTRDLKYGFDVAGNSWLFMHTLCPLIGLISFILFDNKEEINKKYIIYPVIFTIIYSIMILIINISGGRVPYASDLEEPTKVPNWFVISLGLGEALVTCGLGFLIRFLRKKFN